MDENNTSDKAVLVEEVQLNLSEKERKKNWEGSIKSSPIGLRHSWAALS